jgi:hypothetical protein
MSQAFPLSTRFSLGGFAFQGFYSEAGLPDRHRTQRDLKYLYISLL